jgi:hypothetical protein
VWDLSEVPASQGRDFGSSPVLLPYSAMPPARALLLLVLASPCWGFAHGPSIVAVGIPRQVGKIAQRSRPLPNDQEVEFLCLMVERLGWATQASAVRQKDGIRRQEGVQE